MAPVTRGAGPERESRDNGGVDPQHVTGTPWPRRGLLPRVARRLIPAVVGLVLALLAAPTALAHGVGVPPEPTASTFLLDWTFDPTVWLPAIGAVLLWRHLVGSVNRAHPGKRVPPRRTVSFVLGVATVLVALDSGIGLYDTTLFSDHMVQHLLLTLVAPPLLLYAGPITLILRASSPETRQRWILPFLHSRVIRALSFPAVSWVLFTGVMWGTHFSPLFELSLENVYVHDLEHLLYLVSALLFWWPIVGPDPSPWRLRPAARVLYAGLQMPQMTFLAVAVYMADTPLYSHYVTTVRNWGPTPLEDQQMAGGIMWVGGDFVFMIALLLLVYVWMQDEERRSVGEDRRLESERAAIREREVLLAARRAREAAASEQAGGPGG